MWGGWEGCMCLFVWRVWCLFVFWWEFGGGCCWEYGLKVVWFLLVDILNIVDGENIILEVNG